MLSPRTISVLSLAAALSAASGANATIWYVRASGPNGSGTSWASPFNTLQGALTAAQSGDTVYIAAGVYKPTLQRDSGFPRSKTFSIKGGVRYLGGFPTAGGTLAQRNPALNPVTISGDLNSDDGSNFAGMSDNVYHVLFLTGNQTGTVIDGVYIRSGNANDSDNSDYGQGGGVCISGSMSGTPQFRSCTFHLNQANRGGGLDGGNVVVVSSVFYSNRAIDTGEGGGANAGNSQFICCKFLGNKALHGGGLKQGSTGMTLLNCFFSGNTALATSSDNWGLGGGAMLIGDSNTAVTACTFTGNVATALTGVDQQDSQGGAIWISSTGTAAKIYNSIVWDNTRNHVTTLVSNVQDQAAQIYAAGALPVTGWDIIQNLGSGIGTSNLSTNPLFINAKGPDNAYGTQDDNGSVSPGSPALDSANATFMPLDAFDADNDGITNEPIPVDVMGLSRYVDDPSAANTGIGGLWNDRGAFERAAPVCYANCDASTTPPVLNVNDFTCFLNKFAAGDSYANCDASTSPPVLNVNDFNCFLNKFTAGCP